MFNFAFAIIAASLAIAGLHGHAPTPRVEVRGGLGASCVGDDGGCGPVDRTTWEGAGSLWLNGHVEVALHAVSLTKPDDVGEAMVCGGSEPVTIIRADRDRSHRFLFGEFAYHFGKPEHPQFYVGLGVGSARMHEVSACESGNCAAALAQASPSQFGEETRWLTTSTLLAGVSVPVGRHFIVRGGGATYGTNSGFDTELGLGLGYRFGDPE